MSEKTLEHSGPVMCDKPENLRVFDADFRADPRWEQFISAHEDALIFHHPSWLNALEKEYGQKCVALACEDGEGIFHGIFPLLRTKGLFVKLPGHAVGARLSSLPRTPLAGPLAKSDSATKMLLCAAIERVRQEPGLQLEVKSMKPGLDKLARELQCVRWRDTYARTLPAREWHLVRRADPCLSEERSCGPCETCQILRFGNAKHNHNVMWAVRKAAKGGLRVREICSTQELRSWYYLYLSGMRRNVVPPRPFRFFEELWNGIAAYGLGVFVVAEDSQRYPAPIVGGSILFEFNQTAIWAFTGWRTENLAQHPNDLVLLHCLRHACKRGCDRFDFGEVAEGHPELAQFKLKWGTDREPMYRYYYPPTKISEFVRLESRPSSMARVASLVWQGLPLGVVRAVGDWINGLL